MKSLLRFFLGFFLIGFYALTLYFCAGYLLLQSWQNFVIGAVFVVAFRRYMGLIEMALNACPSREERWKECLYDGYIAKKEGRWNRWKA